MGRYIMGMEQSIKSHEGSEQSSNDYIPLVVKGQGRPVADLTPNDIAKHNPSPQEASTNKPPPVWASSLMVPSKNTRG